MGLINKYQARNLRRLLKEQRLNQKEFANTIHTREQTVTRWIKETNSMSKNYALKIQEYFPEYCVEFLLGITPYKNGKDEFAAKAWDAINQQAFVSRAVANVLEHVGYTAYSDNRLTDGASYFEYYEITRTSDGEVLKMPCHNWDDFCDEICAYAEMRLNLMFERGCW